MTSPAGSADDLLGPELRHVRVGKAEAVENLLVVLAQLGERRQIEVVLAVVEGDGVGGIGGRLAVGRGVVLEVAVGVGLLVDREVREVGRPCRCRSSSSGPRRCHT